MQSGVDESAAPVKISAMTSPLLITAFSAFPGVDDNPTETLLKSLDTTVHPLLADARKLVLPTVYGLAPDTMIEALTPMPRAILMTGYSGKAGGIVLERRATGMRLIDKPDASGTVPHAGEQDESRFDTWADVDAIHTRLIGAGIPAELSDDAGGYVCNHVYHAALSGPCIPTGGPLGLFVHLPALPDTPLAQTAAATMDLSVMQNALAVIAQALLEQETFRNNSET